MIRTIPTGGGTKAGTGSVIENPEMVLVAKRDPAMDTRHATGVILILISATVFSTAGLFVKGVESDAWAILFWRGLSAALFTTLYIAWRGSLQREFAGMGKHPD